MQEFVPLEEAAKLAYAGLIEEQQRARDPRHLEVHLTYIAGELATILPVFSRIDGAEPQMLPPELVVRGRVSRGGRLISLESDLAPVGGLCVRRAELELAIEQLRHRLSGLPGD